MNLRLITPLLVLSLCPLLSRADSPLTSTDFHQAYLQNKWLSKFEDETSRHLTPEHLKILSHRRLPLSLKLAVVNQVGWAFQKPEGNGQIWLEHIAGHRKTIPSLTEHTLSRFSAEELTIYCYLEAMDHYLDDQHLLTLIPILDQAIEKHRQSFGIHLVKSLIVSQTSDDWGAIWPAYEKVLNDPSLQDQLRPAALKILSDYLVLYKDQ